MFNWLTRFSLGQQDAIRIDLLVKVRDRVCARPDYPAGATMREFTRYMDRITGCEVAGKGMAVKDACDRWNAALDRIDGR